MAYLETVGIKVFSDRVSSYIKKVSEGVKVFISDRGRIVAELSEPKLGSDSISNKNGLTNTLLIDNLKAGSITLGTKVKEKFPRGKPLLRSGDSQRILDDLRQDR